MASSVESLVERVLGELHRIVQTETVIGQPFQAGDLTIIPVSKISFGFGAGGGQEGKGQSGTGGGANIEPIAFLIVDADGRVQVASIGDQEAGWNQIIGLVPEAIAKIKKFVSKNKEKEKEKDAKGEGEGEGEGD